MQLLAAQMSLNRPSGGFQLLSRSALTAGGFRFFGGVLRGQKRPNAKRSTARAHGVTVGMVTPNYCVSLCTSAPGHHMLASHCRGPAVVLRQLWQGAPIAHMHEKRVMGTIRFALASKAASPGSSGASRLLFSLYTARSPTLSSVAIIGGVGACVQMPKCMNAESCLKRVRVAYGVCVRMGSGGAYGASGPAPLPVPGDFTQSPRAASRVRRTPASGAYGASGASW